METSKLKNIVVLNNLPSNIIDEAIIVLKANKKLIRPQIVESNKAGKEKDNNKRDKEYILKEAEMLVNKYISKVEERNREKINEKKTKAKYMKLRKYAVITTIAMIIELVLIIF